MNYREKMREQLNKYPYGEYYGLKPNQPKDIIRLLNEMDNADECIKKIFFEKENLQSKIDKAIEILNDGLKQLDERNRCEVYSEEYLENAKEILEKEVS